MDGISSELRGRIIDSVQRVKYGRHNAMALLLSDNKALLMIPYLCDDDGLSLSFALARVEDENYVNNKKHKNITKTDILFGDFWYRLKTAWAVLFG